MLELVGVKSGYGPIEALKGIDLQVGEGEIVALIGANGAGKSTCLKTIVGLLRPTAGQVRFCGQDTLGLKPQQLVAQGMSLVPEGRRIFGDLTVGENLGLGAYLTASRAQVQLDLAYVFDLFPILQERQKQRAGTLSGGQQQMLALGRALMGRPKFLLLDEPSLGLAPLIIKEIFAMIQRINREQKTTILLVEQNAHLALKTAQRAYVLESGVLTLQGLAKELLGNKEVQAAYLGLV
ncbi:MAG: ABC transporter ATP-binding protein [Candidatus Lambdaproteobacteria bacterium RIFOXYD1_FULL_56_27]|uniref:ABC transporter ATP-binding protein n=1 Tax=Candidatus Lambdaproteobacteria bacterium RIFOXYD2_FULL_56_26 TaxID=1817773 RepID=A0A1F6GSI4_9PROT|nr:MAG: ABC transporter ATP-binding protein [Candidatus Lambdaproteobacteria bacterium RIFOXYD2_FULL_56_26]OGH01351.1 MAG: ABC transporter ATP-binding protein [Candidatus Lambdaproteobacteria bacterium RIFOXYC1_FULL_56_13]OGH06892.1 MAG: ABC transporter ATP-binding protein [Candidatus Lambdaproteobacteria bacterium RIFOXYD1_FULL_56_27]